MGPVDHRIRRNVKTYPGRENSHFHSQHRHIRPCIRRRITVPVGQQEYAHPQQYEAHRRRNHHRHFAPGKVPPDKRRACHRKDKLNAAQPQPAKHPNEEVPFVAPLVELRVAHVPTRPVDIANHRPSAPPTGPVLLAVAQLHQVPHADGDSGVGSVILRPVLPPGPPTGSALHHGAGNTSRRERVAWVGVLGEDARGVLGRVAKTSPAVMYEHGEKTRGTVEGAQELGRGELAPVNTGAAQVDDVGEVEVAENKGLELLGKRHQGPWGEESCFLWFVGTALLGKRGRLVGS